MLNQFNASLWGDEAFSAYLSSKSIPEIIKIIVRDTSPPLYNITEHLWFNFFGTSEVAIRALSFFYFLIAVFFVFKIGEYLWDKRTGFLAGTLTFLNPFFFTYAFEGRMYSILAATVTASMYFFITRKWLGYVVATTAALYSHHFAIFALFVQGFWFTKEFVFGKRKAAWTTLKAFLVVGLLYLPWLMPLYNQTQMVGGGFWLGRPTVSDLINLITKYLAEGINSPLTKPALAAMVAILALRNYSKNWQKTFFLGSWFFVPILITFIVSQKFTSIFFDRYLLYTIPGAMLLAASQRREVSKIAIGALIALFLVIDIFYFTHPTKRPFREFSEHVKETAKGDDILINWNGGAHHLWESKYYGLTAPLYLPEGLSSLPFFVGTALMTDEDVVSNLPIRLDKRVKVQRVGVITSDNVEEISLPGYTRVDDQAFGELKIVWFSPQ